MTTYSFKAMDQRGKEVADVVEAESPDQAVVLIREKGLFPTSIKPASQTSGDSPPPPPPPSGQQPEGRATAKGRVKCVLQQGGTEVSGSFNLWGEQGKVYIILELDDSDVPYLKIPVEDVARVQVSGLLSKRLTLHLKTGSKYVLSGDVAEMNKYCQFGQYVSGQV
jgi:hypothetical protein